MQETEVKIIEVNREKIEQTLTCLGAKKVFDGDIQTFFFDFGDGRIIKARDVLRLREEQDKTELTYKKVHATQTAKKAQEYTVEISNMEIMKKILENLGLTVTESMQKHRVSYTLDHVRFDIDRYFGSYGYIPEFMEIEAESIGLIRKYAELLGFKARDCLPWSTNELIQHYSIKKGENEQWKISRF
jgi:adenylate cyclase class 2